MTTWNENFVVMIRHKPDDIFVVTTIQGRRFSVQPIAEYEKALATARAFAGHTPHTIKVLCMSLRELLAFMGASVAGFVECMSPAVEQEFRELTIDACLAALRECNEPNVRGDAERLLSDLGVIKRG